MVPKLKGKTLAAAKKAITAAACKLGKVKTAKGTKKGAKLVVTHSRVVKHRTKINLTLGVKH